MEEFKPLFRDLFVHSRYEYLDSHSCIPFTKIKSPSSCGVARLIYLFHQTSWQPERYESNILVFGFSTPIMVPLTAILLLYVYEYLHMHGCLEEDPEEKTSGRDVCSGLLMVTTLILQSDG